ncbi:MAG: hybrid sensor histidine kinase/response regulator [Bacteroidales bacterium]|nr:hybrid sensor histidine kinase/response regulator [Bacteroidales bacterium]
MASNDKINYKILIVDDQQKNIQILGSLLRQENYIIGVATNGKQALEILIESNDYDLILLDVTMPVMNGFEACKAIRDHKSLKEIPIIFLTALADTDNIVSGFEAGGQDYVTKPFNSNELLARVKTHLELKHSKDQLKQVNKWLDEKVAERTEELSIANKKLLQLDTAKTEFLDIISHEIRTPLNGIVGALSLLNEFQLPQEVNEMMNILDLSANRLEEFSIKALDISHFNAKGEEALFLKYADINEITVSNIEKHKESAEEKNINIVQKRESEDTFTKLDEAFMDKCFSYLIDNAIKFGNTDSQVLIKTTSDNKSILVSVENEGIPFPENFNISNIQPFNTNNHVDQNPALSLFLCKQIIEAHDGKIEIMNTNKGARVTVIIPKTGIDFT